MERRLVWTYSHSVLHNHCVAYSGRWYVLVLAIDLALSDRIYFPRLTLSHQVMSFSTVFQLCFQTSPPFIFWPPLHPLPCFRTHPRLSLAHSHPWCIYTLSQPLEFLAISTASALVHTDRVLIAPTTVLGSQYWTSINVCLGSWDLMSIRVNIASWIWLSSINLMFSPMLLQADTIPFVLPAFHVSAQSKLSPQIPRIPKNTHKIVFPPLSVHLFCQNLFKASPWLVYTSCPPLLKSKIPFFHSNLFQLLLHWGQTGCEKLAAYYLKQAKHPLK